MLLLEIVPSLLDPRDLVQYYVVIVYEQAKLVPVNLRANSFQVGVENRVCHEPSSYLQIICFMQCAGQEMHIQCNFAHTYFMLWTVGPMFRT